MLVAITVDGQPQVLGERVDHRHSHAVQTAGNLVRIGVEFATGVQHGHHYLGSGPTLFRMQVNGNAASVVAHTDSAVVVDGDDHLVAIARQRLVKIGRASCRERV